MRDHTLVAVVPVTDDAEWATAAIWDVARTLARSPDCKGRGITFGDLCVESPLLHGLGGPAGSPGLAEAFAAGTPLSEIVQARDGIHVLPAGTGSLDGALLRGSSRWARLRAGFKAEGALLMVCVRAEGLSELGAIPDAILALAPMGVDLGSPAGRYLLAARGRGSALLGVVRERGITPTRAAFVTSVSRSSRLRPMLVAAVATFAIASAALLATAKESFLGHDPAALASLPVLPAADSGGWTVQLAAYGTAGRALAHAGRLAAAGLPAFISPLTPDASGALWYRVQVGAYPTRDAAATARDACRRLGLTDGAEGALRRAPYSLALTHPVDVARLEAAGFAAVRWGAQGPVLVGAYETPEQADVAVSLLERIGISTTVISRTDPTP
jgi:SPOR domain